MYEVFEHTADLGLRIRAATADELFAEAGRALLSIVVDNPDAVRPIQTRDIQIAGAAIDYLLFDWLTELLYAFDAERLLCCDFSTHVSEAGLQANLRGETA